MQASAIGKVGQVSEYEQFASVEKNSVWSKPEKKRRTIRKQKGVTVPYETIMRAKTAVSLVVQQVIQSDIIEFPIFNNLRELEEIISIRDVIPAISSMYSHPLMQKHLQNVATPMMLVHEVLSNLKIKKHAKILCMFNVEWVAYLVKVLKYDVNNIYFLDDGLDIKDGTGKIVSIKSWVLVNTLGIPVENLIYHTELEVKKMKFDYIVGNPPYLKRGWKSFLQIMIDNSRSHVACICPDPTANRTDFGSSVREMLMNAGVQSITECTNSFEKVDSGKISYFICDKNSPAKEDVFVMGGDIRMALRDKVLSFANTSGESFFCRGSQASIKCSKEKTPIGENNVSCIYSVTNTEMEIVYVRANEFPKRTKNKDKFNGRFLAINRFFGKNTNDPIYEIDEMENKVVGYNVIVFKMENGETLENFRSLYCSKLYKWMMFVLRNGTFDITQSNLILLPRLDLTKEWTDEELYQVFNLSPEEIELVETEEIS